MFLHWYLKCVIVASQKWIVGVGSRYHRRRENVSSFEFLAVVWWSGPRVTGNAGGLENVLTGRRGRGGGAVVTICRKLVKQTGI